MGWRIEPRRRADGLVDGTAVAANSLPRTRQRCQPNIGSPALPRLLLLMALAIPAGLASSSLSTETATSALLTVVGGLPPQSSAMAFSGSAVWRWVGWGRAAARRALRSFRDARARCGGLPGTRVDVCVMWETLK